MTHLEPSHHRTCGDYQYALLGHGAAQLTSYDGVAPALALPQALEGLRITVLGHGAFYDCDTLRRIMLPHGLREIGAQAFHFCTGLESIVVPDTVCCIGDEAFAFCDALRSAALPAHTRLEGNPFAPCPSLERFLLLDDGSTPVRLAIRDGVLYDVADGRIICAAAMGACGTHRVPDGIHSIAPAAFYHCEGLSHIHLPASVTDIGIDAFADCPALLHVPAGSYAETWCRQQADEHPCSIAFTVE